MNDPERINLFEKMLFIRSVENTIIKEYPKQEMRCPIHLSIGQEAVAVGVCANLGINDKIYSNHRCHAHYLARGGNLYKMFAELYGKEDGCCGGRGGSMHLFDDNVGHKASIPIVGSGIPLAVGSAFADKLNGINSITAVFFGDGAIEEGVFHECANFASLNDIPVIFICENNFYSCYSHISKRQPVRNLEILADSHLIKTQHCSGNDVLKVYECTNNAVNYVKFNQKPVFLLFDTYRQLEHCGTLNDDHYKYRDETEINYWFDNDPVLNYGKFLINQGITTQADIEILENIINIRIQSELNLAIKANFPDPESISNNVYKF